MPTPVKNPEPAKIEPVAPEQPATVRVIVHPRRSAVYQVQIGSKIEDGVEVPVFANKLAMGGEEIEVSLHDAEFMREHGFTISPEGLAAFRGAAEMTTGPTGDVVVRHDLAQSGSTQIGLQSSSGW